MCNMRLPEVVSEWLNKRVLSGLTWCSIQCLLLCPDLFADENASLGLVPEALNIDCT
ncbi:hypothetical protein DFH28DRAFT_971517 [Melampsora americana]|nr:hypothetical protein DFH28DRAFT_971517 [Melampsora americana]